MILLQMHLCSPTILTFGGVVMFDWKTTVFRELQYIYV